MLANLSEILDMSQFFLSKYKYFFFISLLIFKSDRYSALFLNPPWGSESPWEAVNLVVDY